MKAKLVETIEHHPTPEEIQQANENEQAEGAGYDAVWAAEKLWQAFQEAIKCPYPAGDHRCEFWHHGASVALELLEHYGSFQAYEDDRE